jgi:hypothetical protein
VVVSHTRYVAIPKLSSPMVFIPISLTREMADNGRVSRRIVSQLTICSDCNYRTKEHTLECHFKISSVSPDPFIDRRNAANLPCISRAAGIETTLLGIIENVGEMAFATVLAVGHGSHEDTSTALGIKSVDQTMSIGNNASTPQNNSP